MVKTQESKKVGYIDWLKINKGLDREQVRLIEILTRDDTKGRKNQFIYE